MRKREHLIPLQESKRIIHLERRGRDKSRLPMVAVLLLVMSVICLLYCAAIALFISHGSSFYLMWGMIGMFLLVLSSICGNPRRMAKIPGWLKGIFLTVVAVGVLIFLVIEGMIVSCMGAQPEAGADYCIILGAQWKESGPSDVLKRRLDKAIEYLNENKETIAIVSGGQGSNEPVSEAEGMQGYLINAGIAPERILVENRSENTLQNLRFSGELLDKEQARVVIVSNNFHVFRAVQIAKKQGYHQVEGLAASAYPGMLPNNMLREFFGVVKDWAVGNL